MDNNTEMFSVMEDIADLCTELIEGLTIIGSLTELLSVEISDGALENLKRIRGYLEDMPKVQEAVNSFKENLKNG